MEENFRFHPAIETAILYHGNPSTSMQDLADRFSISKQAISKRVKKAEAFFRTFEATVEEDPETQRLRKENQRLQGIITELRLQLIIFATLKFLANCLKERIERFFPRFRLTRFKPREKKYILDMCRKFQRAGGLLKVFCKAIGKSPETINNWQRAYDKHGMAGLCDKPTRPHHFSNKIPPWLMKQLTILFLRFPKWKPYQYHKYMQHNPAIQWSLSVPTVKKMKDIHTRRRLAEQERISKTWVFEPTFDVWTIDFTCLLDAGKYRIELFTVSDHRSRFFFEPALFIQPTTALVMKHLTKLFTIYGKPALIKADNGKEFRTTFREELEEFCVYLLNSPVRHPQFCGSHERIHKELKGFIEKFADHCDLLTLSEQLDYFRENHNFVWTYERLGNKTPGQIYFSEPDFIPEAKEIVTPYKKEGELRMKFTNRHGGKARMALPLLH